MEAKVPRPRGRPRKRQRLEDDNRKLNNRGKKQVLEVEPAVPISLLGCYMLKDFDDNEVFLGKIVSYDTGLYRVIYEDGDCEELESGDLRRLIISDSYLDDELRVRRKKLDKLILKKEEKKKRNSPENKAVELPNQVNGVQARAVTNSEDGDSYSDSESSESGDKRGSDLEIEAPLVPPVDLPPSSGTIGIPEEAVAHLLSVYGFLRSFSFQLYICPFELNDFVGALYFSGPNSLLDAVHVALLRALKGHLERLSSSKSVLASKCLRCIDWSLLDVLTWPVYLVQYFTAMGHASGPQWNIFNKFVVEIEYYSLPIGMKLKILQILCDDIFDVADLRDEIDAREESEIGFDPDRVATGLLENVPRRVHPRFAKTSAYKEKEVTDSSTNESKDLDSRCTNGGSNEVSSDLDGNSDECRICGMDGTLLCCDGCPLAYHSRCIGVVKMYIPDGPWFCPECTINKKGPKIAHGTSLRGAVQFGMDPHGRLFLGTCNHLLVLNISVNGDAVVKYYNVNDISKVVLVLISASSHTLEYVEICKAITQYWDLPEGISLREGEIGLTQAKDREDGKVSEITKSDSANISNRSHTQTVFDLPTSTLGNTNSAVTGGSCGIQGKKLAARVTYLGLSFKPNTYNNHYTNGELAVSAAASLAVLSSEETHEPDLRKYNSAKKAASSNILEQMKAFSLVAPRFFWPSPDKKEITRERCGWCHSCRLTSASRRGCMLNAAVAGATKGAMKIFSGLFPLKNGEGVLSSIAAYILYLEESLRGLIAGPFLSESPRKQWRKQVEEASTCKALKAPLLELEENICSIALSCDWFKQMDDWLIEHSIFQSAPVTLGVPQRRGPGRTKQNTQAEVTAEGSDADSFTWWRGGKLSKVILLKAVLSQPATKKAAWQGGSKKIPGLNYGDASYIPRRSRRSFWKAAVESSKNISQLALQVRYLDMSLRWRELVRPDQNLQNVKGPETDVAIFRNARICDKKLSDNKVSYGVFFGNQKHLPSRVMKNIMEVEKTQDRNEKYWLQEAHVPLYLIKEFEESLHRVQMPSSTKKPSKKLSKLQRKQLKASLMDIFSYIASRRDKMEKCSCASCDHDVLLRDTTTCSSCHGFCHKDCTSMSQHTNGNVEVLVTCKRCYLSKTRVPTNINHRQSTAPQFTINVRHQNAVIPVIKVKPPSQQLSSQKPRENTSGVKQVTPDSSVSKSKQKTLSCGVIWRKKNVEDTGVDFRNQNILLAGRSDKPSLEPVCGICLLPYNPGLTYIHCTKCEKWFHTEAVKLKDSQIPEVVGFKCCKCRRIRSPDCPYMDPKLKEQKQIKRIVFTNQKQRQGNSGLDSDSERMSEQKDSKPSTPLPATPLYPPDDVFIPEDDPLLVSVSKVKQITPSSFDLEWSTTAFAPGPQKLPVRRQVKREDSDAAYPELHPIVKPEAEEQALPVLTEWDLSGELLFDYEDMEFEPQTYFSLTELLTADDSGGGQYQENGDMVVSGNPQFEPTEKEECEDDMGPCQRCLQMDPAPDLLCTVCGLLIHSHCSPWSALPGSSWSCGQCREWQ
ncbi:PHD type transcription factor with transmembrane domain protein (PTM) [Arabidopsis thaliana]|uniref:Isoform 2 of DDT domain-containing protein PTM n=1 Tax=Arabidopsis thaliana TaxID=3702 RepID=F4JYC8-2|nr:PHD type transcription factor with transmembrane domain protein (PTM) [Arabidopsis thaliana]AED93946.1 PHD type transcription factor with transmembrane domain protein (PTM) [Arabidopsis thaliana]|eukprot:NP_198371.3 PHD type transcription factor with transmembrane domain protein (PTM) [Arabidopsis thaliana]